MKRLLAIAALLLASSTAQAQYQFEYGGRTIRIDPDRGTVSIPGVYDNSAKKAKRAKGDSDASRNKPSADPQTAPAPADTAAAPSAPAAPPAPPPPGTETAIPDRQPAASTS